MCTSQPILYNLWRNIPSAKIMPSSRHLCRSVMRIFWCEIFFRAKRYISNVCPELLISLKKIVSLHWRSFYQSLKEKAWPMRVTKTLTTVGSNFDRRPVTTAFIQELRSLRPWWADHRRWRVNKRTQHRGHQARLPAVKGLTKRSRQKTGKSWTITALALWARRPFGHTWRLGK